MLDLEEMIPASEGPLLGPAPFVCLFAYQIRVGPVNAPSGFNPFKVRGITESLLNGPLRTP
jgi:hypothetical protein